VVGRQEAVVSVEALGNLDEESEDLWAVGRQSNGAVVWTFCVTSASSLSETLSETLSDHPLTDRSAALKSCSTSP